MLVELRLQQFGVFADARLEPGEGLTVLSGETGAGKSLLVGALLFLLGDRGGSDRVRTGADRAIVEGTFDVPAPDQWVEWFEARGVPHGLPDDRGVVIRREVQATGRSRAWVNGAAVTNAVLAELGARLVTVHGQHESQSLGDAATQRTLLDAYAEASAVARALATAHAAWRDAQARQAALARDRVAAERQADYLRFVAREVEQVQPLPGEPEQLDDELRRLTHAEELRALAAGGVRLLDGGDEADGVLARLSAVRRTLQQLGRIDPTTSALLEGFDQVEVALGELARDLAHYGDGIAVDPERLQEVEARRGALQALLRKYGPGVSDALQAAADARAQLALVDGAARDDAQAQEAVDAAWREVERLARQLSAARVRAAASLARDVSALLPAVGMPDARFAVTLDALATPEATGAERPLFLAQLNAGEPMRPIGRAASGGELARLLLAVATVLARVERVPTLVLDEIDAGIGGAVAVQVGALMQRLAASHQVLAVTHLAQIAACATRHGAVTKTTVDGETVAELTVVEGEARITELARMLGGDASGAEARDHARAVLVRAQPRAPTAAAGSRGTSAPRSGRSRSG
jgi:DNA repair protein RecN (Recombination protein N)